MAHPAPTPNVAPNAEVGWTEPYSKLIFENAAIGIALVDLEGRPIAANAALQRMLGYTESELQARTFPEFTFPDDVTSDWTLFEELLAGTRQSYQIEKRYVRKDGRLVWGRLNASMVLGGPDGTSHCVGILEDITEQKSADEDRARLAAIVTSSHDAIIGQRLDGAIASWNPAAERLFGYAADEVLGRSLAFLVPADRQDEWAANMDRVRSGEQIEAYETTRVCKDGRCVQVSLSVSPIVDQRVQVVGFSSIARDITARQRSDAALRASEERFVFSTTASPFRRIPGGIPATISCSRRSTRRVTLSPRVGYVRGSDAVLLSCMGTTRWSSPVFEPASTTGVLSDTKCPTGRRQPEESASSV
jgi:PAS domain S-box-containing protein